MGSDLPYQTEAYLRKQISYNRQKQNTHKMRADAMEEELARRLKEKEELCLGR